MLNFLHMFRTLIHVLARPSAVAQFILFVPIVLLLLFVAIEWPFIANVLAGTFPPDLFFAILPTLVHEFLFGEDLLAALHHTTIAVLASIYLILLLYLFSHKRYLSLKSIGVSVAAFAGISLGIVCLSCGALAGLVLVSVLGVSAAPFLALHNSSLFFFASELLLLLSIILVLVVIRRFEQ